jgi:hypothetical protein
MNQQPPDRLLRSFERYLRATNRSERTVGNYLENLHQVEAFLQPRGVRLRDATPPLGLLATRLAGRPVVPAGRDARPSRTNVRHPRRAAPHGAAIRP